MYVGQNDDLERKHIHGIKATFGIRIRTERDAVVGIGRVSKEDEAVFSFKKKEIGACLTRSPDRKVHRRG